MLAYPFNDFMIKVKTLFTKTKILQYFSEFLNFKTFSCSCPIMRWYCQFFLPSLQFKLGLLEIKGIISYLSLPRLNAIVKKTMEIVWLDILCGIVLNLMIYLNMWLTPNGYVQTQIPDFFIDLICKLSLWINYLQILQSVVLDNMSCFCKLSFLEFFVNNVNDSFQILQVIVPHKFENYSYG